MRELLRILRGKLIAFIVSLVWLASNIVTVYAQSESVPPKFRTWLINC